MKITVLGAGAMGSLFGGYLSENNEVTVLDVSVPIVEAINKHGVIIKEKDGSISTYYPRATDDASSIGTQDLIIVFVKSMFTVDALERNINLIGPETYLMSLQNGAGHESKLNSFVEKDRVIIGSTQHNSSVIEPGVVYHGGSGMTSIGLLEGTCEILGEIAQNFTKCGFECKTETNIQKQIWEKLFTNTAASSLTAIIQVPLGFIYTDSNSNFIMRNLCREAVEVANCLGLGFDLNEVIEKVQTVLINAPNGYTSIYADIRNGRKTEVDTISGSIVDVANELGIPVPYHEMTVKCIHALETKNKENIK